LGYIHPAINQDKEFMMWVMLRRLSINQLRQTVDGEVTQGKITDVSEYAG
jgi:hypothetical protein